MCQCRSRAICRYARAARARALCRCGTDHRAGVDRGRPAQGRLQVDGGRFKAELIEAGRTGSQALKTVEAAARDAGNALDKTSASTQKVDREQQSLSRSAERLKRQYAEGYQAAQEQSRASALLSKGLLTQAEYASVVEGIGRKYVIANTNAHNQRNLELGNRAHQFW